MSTSSSEKLLNSDNLLSAMFKLALPMMISGFVAAFYNTVDSVFVGRYVGDFALAALAVNNTIQVSIIAMSALFSVGVSSIISRSLGAGNKEKARSVLITGLGSSFLGLILFAWSLLFNLDKVLLWIGSPPEVLAYSRQYGGVILWFAFIGPVNDVLSAGLRASGLAHWVMALMLTGAFSNIVLDALFIIVFGWGVTGAAVATVIAQVIVCVVAFLLVNRHYDIGFRISKIIMQIRPKIFLEIVSVGFPATIKSSIFALMNLSANRALTSFGADAVAGFGVIYKIIQLAYQPIFGFNLGVQPFIGYSYGSNRFEKVRRIIFTANGAAMVMGLFPMAFLLFAPEPLFRLFTKSDTIIAYTRACSISMGLTFFLYGFQMTSTGAAMAMGHTMSSLLMACFRPAVMAFLMIYLPPVLGVNGVWATFPITDIISSLFIFWMLRREFQLLKKKESLSNEVFHA